MNKKKTSTGTGTRKWELFKILCGQRHGIVEHPVCSTIGVCPRSRRCEFYWAIILLDAKVTVGFCSDILKSQLSFLFWESFSDQTTSECGNPEKEGNLLGLPMTGWGRSRSPCILWTFEPANWKERNFGTNKVCVMWCYAMLSVSILY